MIWIVGPGFGNRKQNSWAQEAQSLEFSPDGSAPGRRRRRWALKRHGKLVTPDLSAIKASHGRVERGNSDGSGKARFASTNCPTRLLEGVAMTPEPPRPRPIGPSRRVGSFPLRPTQPMPHRNWPHRNPPVHRAKLERAWHLQRARVASSGNCPPRSFI